MKKNYLIALLALICNFAFAQVEVTTYKGAFAPAPVAMWTDNWTNFDPANKVYPSTNTVISTNITTNTTWTKNKVYELQGRITVKNNAILTIEPGTIIRSNVQASVLVITRGSKLIANGTAEEPIVFTSKDDGSARQRGDWGGIVLLGRAKYNVNNGVNFIEGISQSVDTEFGGGLSPIDNDNSGSLKFVRIEFAGYVFSQNNELNGLTMGAVGSGTTIDYVQVSFSNDDAFEWFGGSVNCKHLVAFSTTDDDFDTDNGYKGLVQFGLSVKNPSVADISTSECFESDNNAAGSATTVDYGNFTSAVFTNFTCIGPNKRPTTSTSAFTTPNTLHDKALRIRRASKLNVFNSIFLDHKKGLVLESIESNRYAYGTDGTTSVAASLKFKNNLIASQLPFSSVNTSGSTTPTTTQMTDWFATTGVSGNNNKTFTLASTAGSAGLSPSILVRPYIVGNANSYLVSSSDATKIDYRPSSDDAKTGASFTDITESTTNAFTALTTTAPAVVAEVSMCRGTSSTSTGPALTATLTGSGASLRWYRSETGGVASFTAPRPLTPLLVLVPPATTDGNETQEFWVSQVNSSGLDESPRSKITVTLKDTPNVTPNDIKSLVGTTELTPIVKIGGYVKTTNTLSYKVATSPAQTLNPGETYFWTVPLGVNIELGQLTNNLVVNFNSAINVSTLGNLSVVVKNTQSGCTSPSKSIVLTAALPAAPSKLTLTNTAIPAVTTGTGSTAVTAHAPITNFGKYMGTSTELTVTATTAATDFVSSYIWELPANSPVTLLKGDLETSTTSTTEYFNVYPFLTPITSSTYRSTVGNRYYKVVTTTSNNGFKRINATYYQVGGVLVNGVVVQPIGGTMTGTGAQQDGSVGTFSPGAGEAFTAVDGITVNPAFPYDFTTTPSVKINLSGVTKVNSTIAGTSGSADTYGVFIGVRSINGVGASTKANVAPYATSKANFIKLSAAKADAPTKVAAYNITTPVLVAIKDAAGLVTTPATVAISDISKYIGTTDILTLAAVPSNTASKYEWILPEGVVVRNSSATAIPTSELAQVGTTSQYRSDDNKIYVDFSGVGTGVTSFSIGVKGVNNIGSSVTVNNATNSTVPQDLQATTFKYVKLLASVPAPASFDTTGTLNAAFSNIECGNTKVYKVKPSLKANSYLVTGPTGSVLNKIVNGVPETSNTTSNELTLTNGVLDFNVKYPDAFVIHGNTTTTDKSLKVRAINGVGNNATDFSKLLATKTITGTISTLIPYTTTSVSSKFNKCITKLIEINSVTGALSYQWTVSNGATYTVESATSILVNFSNMTFTQNTVVVTVQAILADPATGCRKTTVVKTITLNRDAAEVTEPTCRIAQDDESSIVSGTDMYPNPTNDVVNFNIEATSKGEVTIAIYSLDGKMVMESKGLTVENGTNSFAENVSSLNRGIYLVKITNTTSNEVVTKKLIKN